jgi:hypothetical protein
MLRRNTILTTAALMTVFAVPASAAPWEDMHSPVAQDAANDAALDVPPVHYPTPEPEPYVLERAYGSPDAADAARGVPSVTHAGPGPYTDSERKLVESPEVQQMVHRIGGEISASSPVVAVSAPSGGFSWGDAGIGAAGMLALFSIAAGSALLVTSRRRRGGFGVAAH